MEQSTGTPGQAVVVLAGNEYAYRANEQGKIGTIVGPTRFTVSGDQQPMVFEPKEGKFRKVETPKAAVRQFIVASEGQYVLLSNPENEAKHPDSESGEKTATLKWGVTHVINGPISFPLWPGEIAQVVDGHQLDPNHYLTVEVYNGDAATENWEKMVMRPAEDVQSQPTGESEEQKKPERPDAEYVLSPDEKRELKTGERLLVMGTDTRFFIPMTGIRVLRKSKSEMSGDNDDPFRRTALTLEQLTYCILLDADGNKRFVYGPRVVFPKPTETFVKTDNNRVFKEIELNDDMGVYVKVIADYVEVTEGAINWLLEKDREGRDVEGGTQMRRGDELFITGKHVRIYQPRAEHAFVRYGAEGDVILFAIAIPDGEARYVLNKGSGSVETVRGPKMFLPDPRSEVIVPRILSEDECKLWFPDNEEAQSHNRLLRESSKKARQRRSALKDVGRKKGIGTGAYGMDVLEEEPAAIFRDVGYETLAAMATEPDILHEEAAVGVPAGQFERRTSFTPPRTLMLRTKYDGAVKIDVWPGYAVQTINSDGERTPVIGPSRILLDYEQILERLALSTGERKSDTNRKRTVYLQVRNNPVSDTIEAETSDGVQVSIKVKYRVDFKEEYKRIWFSVEDYVKLMTDHLRSVIRAAVKMVGIREFRVKHTGILRDTILGTKPEEPNSKRPGKSFDENGMHVYDVEVTGMDIENASISRKLVESEEAVVAQELEVESLKRQLELEKQTQSIQGHIDKAKNSTVMAKLNLIASEEKKSAENEKAKQTALSELQSLLDAVHSKDLARRKADDDQKAAAEESMAKARVAGDIDKAKAVQPGLIEALVAASGANLLQAAMDAIPSAMDSGIGRIFGDSKEGLPRILDILGGPESDLGSLFKIFLARNNITPDRFEQLLSRKRYVEPQSGQRRQD